MAVTCAVMLIDILIPTFNRCVDLLRNLRFLTKQIEKNCLHEKVRLVISDNFSTDGTQEQVLRFISATKDKDIAVIYSRNDRNLGLEKNVVRLLELASADFLLWIGDDDYLADGYLEFLLKSIEERPLLGCVIPGLASLHADGTVTKARIEEFWQRTIEPGFGGVLKFSHLAHQMSGLLVRRDGLLKEYAAKPEYRNPYLFIYFVASRMLRFESIYAPGFPTRVTVFNAKDWGYNSIGLLDEVFKNYLALHDYLTRDQIEKLLLHFAMMHSYRLAFRPLKPQALVRQYHAINRAADGGTRFRLRLAQLFAKEALLSLAGR